MGSSYYIARQHSTVNEFLDLTIFFVYHTCEPMYQYNSSEKYCIYVSFVLERKKKFKKKQIYKERNI